AKLDTFKQHFTGPITLPGDSDYSHLSHSFMHSGAPAVVVHPRTPADVALAIAYARDNSLLLSIRSGGHSGAGWSTNTGGMVIDLSLMNSVEVVDAKTHRVKVGAG